MNRRAVSWTRVARELRMKEATLVLSIQHTGTWFTIELLRRHPDAGPFFEMKDALGMSAFTTGSISHAHLVDDNESVHPADAGKFIPFDIAHKLSKAVPTVIPVRDPMRAILSRQARHPFLCHTYIVEAFEALSVFPVNDNVVFLPIDGHEYLRKQVVTDVLTKVGLTPYDDYVSSWVRSWRRFNESHLTAEKQWYAKDKWEPLKDVLAVEVNALLKARVSIIPFLTRVGYPEMNWWRM